MTKRIGQNTMRFSNPPSIIGNAAIVGKKESEGPLAAQFDSISYDSRFGQETWEKSESELQRLTFLEAIEKSGIDQTKINYVFAGDLLNQCVASAYSMRDSGLQFFGLYGACSTMAESLTLAAMTIDGGFADYAAAITSSHFCSAERQFRFPLDYGGQRTPTAQRTVTGSGAAILSASGGPPYILHCTPGKIVDLGITDINNMGAAMAPAACDTITAFFKDTALAPDSFDLILTGDLGDLGATLLMELCSRDNLELKGNYDDCGRMIFDIHEQDVDAGGSGCGCSAAVLCSFVLNKMRRGEYNNILFVATGALMSPVTLNQKESIPAIAHAVHISNFK